MSYFKFKSVGYLKPTSNWWLRVSCDPEIIRYYCWLSKSWGIPIDAGSKNGPHITVVKGKRPKFIKEWWKLKDKPVEFEYTNQFRDNGYHVWLDVKCTELYDIRDRLGLRPKPWHSLHLTIGRLRHNVDHKSHEPRPRRKKR